MSVRRLPFTLGFLWVMVVANWLAGTLAGVLPSQPLTNWGISHRAVLDGDLYRIVTGTFLSHDVGMFLRQFCFAAAVIGAYEWREGTGRAIAVFFTIDVLGTLVVLFAILPLLVSVFGVIDGSGLLDHDVGMSAGGFGLVGALLAALRYRWALLVIIILAIAAKIWISFEPIADTAHLLCLVMGFLLQSILNVLKGANAKA